MGSRGGSGVGSSDTMDVGSRNGIISGWGF